MNVTIPRAIHDQHQDKWIAWDTDAGAVVAVGASMEEVGLATQAARQACKLIY
jgi:hypothetical protein